MSIATQQSHDVTGECWLQEMVQYLVVVVVVLPRPLLQCRQAQAYLLASAHANHTARADGRAEARRAHRAGKGVLPPSRTCAAMRTAGVRCSRTHEHTCAFDEMQNWKIARCSREKGAAQASGCGGTVVVPASAAIKNNTKPRSIGGRKHWPYV